MIDESEESFLERICGLPNLTYKDIRGMGVIEDSHDTFDPLPKESPREFYFLIRFFEEKNKEFEEKCDKDGDLVLQGEWLTKSIKISPIYSDLNEVKRDYQRIIKETERDYAKDISLIGWR